MKCTDGYATDDACKLEPEQMLTTNNIHPGIQARLTTAVLLGRSTVFGSASDCSPCWARTSSVTNGVDAAATTRNMSHNRDRRRPYGGPGWRHPPSRHRRCGGQVPHCSQQAGAALRGGCTGGLSQGHVIAASPPTQSRSASRVATF